MKKSSFVRILAILLSFPTGAAYAQERDQVQVAGSSTVLPYAKIVAEIFGETYPHFKTPVIESGGTGAGIKEFCRAIGANTIDVANASRPMKITEWESCHKAGVEQIYEIRFGYDGVVITHENHEQDWDFTPTDIYQAMAAQLVIAGQLVANPYRKWNEIDSKFPPRDISLYIPGEKHGTREVVEEKLMLAGCRDSGVYDQLQQLDINPSQVQSNCMAVRKDGLVVDIDGDYSETLARIEADKNGFGILGLSFYENNADRLKLATISGIMPTVETIASAQYSLSRPLYFYVKGEHLETVAGLREYVTFFLSDQMAGSDGALADYGLIAAPIEERTQTLDNFNSGKVLQIAKDSKVLRLE